MIGDGNNTNGLLEEDAKFWRSIQVDKASSSLWRGVFEEDKASSEIYQSIISSSQLPTLVATDTNQNFIPTTYSNHSTIMAAPTPDENTYSNHSTIMAAPTRIHASQNRAEPAPYASSPGCLDQLRISKAFFNSLSPTLYNLNPNPKIEIYNSHQSQHQNSQTRRSSSQSYYGNRSHDSQQPFNSNQHPSIAHHQYYLPSRSSREAMFASALPSQYGSALPSQYASALPSQYASALPSQYGSALPSQYGSALPSQYGSALPSQYGSVLPLPSQYGSALPLPFQHSQLSVKYNGEQTPILYTTNPLLPTQLVQYGNEPNPLSYLGSNHMPAVTTTQEVTSRLEEPPPTTSHSSSVYTLKTSPELILEPANNEEKQNLSSEPSNSQKDPTRDSNSPTGAFFTTSLIYLAGKISGLFEGTLPNSEKKEAKAETNTTSQTPPVLIENQDPPESSTPSKVPTLIRSDNSRECFTKIIPDSGRQIAQAG